MRGIGIMLVGLWVIITGTSASMHLTEPSEGGIGPLIYVALTLGLGLGLVGRGAYLLVRRPSGKKKGAE